MWFIFTLVTILFWSGSDLFSKMGSAPDDKNSHWKMVLAVGAVMGLHLSLIHILSPRSFQRSSVSVTGS